MWARCALVLLFALAGLHRTPTARAGHSAAGALSADHPFYRVPLPRIAPPAATTAATATAEGVPKAALPPHPRLILNATGLARLRELVASDAEARAYHAAVLATGHALLNGTGIADSNCTLVGVCRGPWFGGRSYVGAHSAQADITTLALLHRLSDHPDRPTVFSSRAVVLLKQVCAFPSWYWPVGQALELSAMAAGVAIGYDWLYPLLSADERALIEAKLTSEGLRKSIRNHHEGMWWTHDVYNWNIVSNGGIVAVALAMADVEPELAQEALSYALDGMASALPSWQPQGVWPEGANYFSFAAEFVRVSSASLSTALGRDDLIMPSKGLCESGHYALHMAGAAPGYFRFNWADGGPKAVDTEMLFFLAHHCPKDAALYAAVARKLVQEAKDGAASLSDLLFFSAAGSEADLKDLPRHRLFIDPSQDRSRGCKTHLGFFRSCWFCPNGSYVAFKGGQNHFDDHGSDSHNNHGHLDVGQFVFEVAGERWVSDLGAGAYDFPDISYFGRFRFSYYKLSSFGHNVLRFNGESQDRFGNGTITALPAANSATIDLTNAYRRGKAELVRRTITLEESGSGLTVHDAWRHQDLHSLTWVLHTTAETAIVNNTAVMLSIGAKQVLVSAAIHGEGIETRAIAGPVDLAFPQTSTLDDGRQIRTVEFHLSGPGLADAAATVSLRLV